MSSHLIDSNNISITCTQSQSTKTKRKNKQNGDSNSFNGNEKVSNNIKSYADCDSMNGSNGEVNVWKPENGTRYRSQKKIGKSRTQHRMA